jgi:ATP-binding cassette subfamily C protein
MSGRAAIISMRGAKGALIAVLLLSGVINALALTGALYMLQVYDRVLASHSVPTLIALSVLAGGLYLAFAITDIIRSQIATRIANRIDERLMQMAEAAALRLPIIGQGTTEATQPVRDADMVRSFLGGPGPLAFLDLPWTPLYIVLIFLMSPPLAYAAAAGLALLAVLALLAELAASRAERDAIAAGARRNAILDANIRSAHVIAAMGMSDAVSKRFEGAHDEYVEAQTRAGDAVGSYAAVSRISRLALQSLLVGLGAYLAIGGDITGGAIIAASIAAGRALAPVEQAIGQWKPFVAFRQAVSRLRRACELAGEERARLELPSPRHTLSLKNVAVAAPGAQRLSVLDVTLTVQAGTVVGIVGSSAAGKSTLARALVGIWPLARGTIRLDGATLDRWAQATLGRHIGYLPQEVELLPGTVAEIVARHELEPSPEAVVAAARAAGVHEMILALPQGYDTYIGAGGLQLSGGQRQRLALARALYGDPFLVVLDEPNSNLDAEGETALIGALQAIKRRGGIAIVVSHRKSLTRVLDVIAVLEAGRLHEINRQAGAPAATSGLPRSISERLALTNPARS